MDRSRTTLTRAQAQSASPQWRLVLGRLMLSLKFPDFATALAFVNDVGTIAEQLDHHPDVDLRWGRVVVSVHSHDVDGLTSRDIGFANAVDDLVPLHAGTVDLISLSRLEIAIDTCDADRIRPFWAAVLGYVERGGQLHDPSSRGPSIWFQDLDEPRPQRNRLHLDVSVPHDVAESRVAAAVDAGGRVVSSEHSPTFWVLADADGNEACLSTWLGRD